MWFRDDALNAASNAVKSFSNPFKRKKEEQQEVQPTISQPSTDFTTKQETVPTNTQSNVFKTTYTDNVGWINLWPKAFMSWTPNKTLNQTADELDNKQNTTFQDSIGNNETILQWSSLLQDNDDWKTSKQIVNDVKKSDTSLLWYLWESFSELYDWFVAPFRFIGEKWEASKDKSETSVYLDGNASDWWTILALKGGADTQYERAKSRYDNAINTARTQTEVNEAILQFYDQTKSLFKTEHEWDIIDWFKYDTKWDYEPTLEEFQEFVASQEEYKNRIAKTTEKWSSEWWKIVSDFFFWWIKLSDSEKQASALEDTREYERGERLANLRNTSLNWIQDQLKRSWMKWAQLQQAEAWMANAAQSYLKGIDDYANTVYAYEELIKNAHQWDKSYTEEEKRILDLAERMRKAEDQMVKNLNTYFMYEARDWVDSNWELNIILDDFWWKSIQQLLNNNIAEILWYWEINWISDIWFDDLTNIIGAAWENASWQRWNRDVWYLDSVSAKDMFAYLATRDTNLYNSSQASNWISKLIYQSQARLQVWMTISELSQQAAYLVPRIFDNAWAKVWISNAWSLFDYADADFTIGMMLETDDAESWRTIKSYALNALEYWPEIVWNLAFDIALWEATAWWSVLLTWPQKLAKLWKWATKAAKVWKVINAVEKTWDAVQDVAKVGKAIDKLSKTKTVANFITNAAVDIASDMTLINWQMATYDPESSSNQSLMMAIWGTILWNVIPWGAKARRLVWKWTLWDTFNMIDFIEEQWIPFARKVWNAKGYLTVEELESAVKQYKILEDAINEAYKWIPSVSQDFIKNHYKEAISNALKQVLNIKEETQLANNIKRILANNKSNPADVVKYILWLWWRDIQVWPWRSTIKLKNWWTRMIYEYAWWANANNLDTIVEWGFWTKIKSWFSEADLENIRTWSSVYWWENFAQNKNNYFDKVDWTYYLNEKWMEHFWVKMSALWNESIWVSIAEAENRTQKLQEILSKMDNKTISEETIDKISNSWAYDEVLNKVKEFIC